MPARTRSARSSRRPARRRESRAGADGARRRAQEDLGWLAVRRQIAAIQTQERLRLAQRVAVVEEQVEEVEAEALGARVPEPHPAHRDAARGGTRLEPPEEGTA